MKLRFIKAEGTGNDFIVLHNPDGKPGFLTTPVVKWLCDRHFGIGSDGILSIEKSENAHLFMRIINPDGTEAEMCGNGIRVTAALAVQVLGITDNPINIETLAGIKPCHYEITNGQVNSVSVDMGKPIIKDRIVNLPNIRFVGWSVNTGNPHFTVPSKDPVQDAKKYGPLLSTHRDFPHGANIEFIKKVGETACELAVYERGAGITLSCGSGTTASISAAVRAEIFPRNTPIKVNLPGGTLWITVNNEGLAVLKGPAKLVFEGEITIPKGL